MNEQRYRDAERTMWAAMGVEPIESWVELASTGSRVRVLTVGEGPPAVFVHGASNSGTSWAALATRLPGTTCHLIDRPGCGLSEPSGRSFSDVGDFRAFASEMTVEVMDGLGLERAHVVATSMGGYHGLATAAAHGDRLTSLLMVGWTLGAANGHTPLIMRLASVRPLAKAMTKMKMSEGMTRSMLKQIGLAEAVAAGRMSRSDVRWFQALNNHTDTLANELDAAPPSMTLRGINDSILLGDDVLGRIEVPTLFLWGSDDPFGGAEVARSFAPRVPGAELQLVPGGHAVWIDDPDGIAERCAAWFSRG